jgi:hypothetical protein
MIMRGEYLLTQIGIIVSGNNACASNRSQALRLPLFATLWNAREAR